MFGFSKTPTLGEVIDREQTRRISRAKKYVSKRLGRDRVLYQWDIGTAQKTYPRTKKQFAAIDAQGNRVFIDPKTGETIFIKQYESVPGTKPQPIDPNTVEKNINKPSEPNAFERHKLTSEEIKKPVEPEVTKKDQATHRKTTARKAREHLKPNIEVTPTAPPLKLRIEKRAYEIWDKGGRVHGQDVTNWIQAKNEFIRAEAYNIYKRREGTRFVGSAEHDWFKAERRIEKELNYPEKAASASNRYQRLIKYKANVVEEKRWKTYVKNPIRNLSKDIKAVLEKGQQSVKSFFKDGDFARKTKLFWSKNRWARGATKGLAATLALNLGLSLIRKTFQGPAIPSEYEKGYDIISSYATDFGSPLKLSKAAHKALRPYHSTVRNSIRTNVNAVIDKNMALYSNQNAIGHMRY